MSAEYSPTVSRRKLIIFGVVAVVAALSVVVTGIKAREDSIVKPPLISTQRRLFIGWPR
jgi:membrane fusion protein (multidrug efflux system)